MISKDAGSKGGGKISNDPGSEDGGKIRSKGKKRERDQYSRILETVKPKGAKYLAEKYRYWIEERSPMVQKKLLDELKKDKERMLYTRMFSSMFRDYHIMERTGYSLTALYPGIELCGEQCSNKAFDILLRGNDGTSLFIQYIGGRAPTPKQLSDRIASRADFLRENMDELIKEYGLGKTIHLGLLLTERERPSLKQGLQMFGRTEGSREFGEVHVMELSLERNTVFGFPAMHGKASIECDGLEVPEGVLLDSHPIDLRAHEYLLFEMATVQGCYAGNLMEKGQQPKEMTLRELESSLLRELGLDRRPETGPPLNFEARRIYARKRLSAILTMALRSKFLEDESVTSEVERKRRDLQKISVPEGMKTDAGPLGTDHGAEDGKKEGTRPTHQPKGPFRIICQGSDLTMVRNNLLNKYLDASSKEGARPLAEMKAVEAYRRRYPRIDTTF